MFEHRELTPLAELAPRFAALNKRAPASPAGARRPVAAKPHESVSDAEQHAAGHVATADEILRCAELARGSIPESPTHAIGVVQLGGGVVAPHRDLRHALYERPQFVFF